MPSRTFNFYIDDSGTRHPDYRPNARGRKQFDWFSLGGVIVDEADEDHCRSRYKAFCAKWGIHYPLHSVEIRGRTDSFRWLKSASESDYNGFMADLSSLLTGLPVFGLACVIDRPGYDHRYRDLYGRRRWELCKTAFSVIAERAAKFAIARDARVRIYPERCSKISDNKLRDYYRSLRVEGLPFDASNSSRYSPLSANELHAVLYDFHTKNKSSPLVQIADLYLHPMCMGGYYSKHRPYSLLVEKGRLVDCHCGSEVEQLGVKYSCFDLVKRQ